MGAGAGTLPARTVCGRRALSDAHKEPTMQVTVKLFATLTRYGRGERAGTPFIMDLPQDAALHDLISKLEIPPEETRILFVNGIIQEPDYRLKDGDEVGLFPPIGGG